jgi:hypothetical protein
MRKEALPLQQILFSGANRQQLCITKHEPNCDPNCYRHATVASDAKEYYTF